MAILGPDGKPIKTADLREEQTLNLRHLHQEFASHPARGLTPQRLARILQSAEQGDLTAQADLFEDMEERDAHLLAEMGKRKRALLVLDWCIEPPKNPTAQEKRITEMVGEVLDSLDDFENVILSMADAIGKGYSCLEIAWKFEDGVWLPDKINLRPQSWFMTPVDARNELRLRDNSAQGAVLKAYGWITHTHKAKEGYVSRIGLYRCLVWPYLFKNFSVRDLAEFLEIYGLPIRLGKYPPGCSEKEKLELLRAVVEVGHNAAGIVPSSMLFEILEAAKGDEKPFEAMIRWAESSMSKAILGGTLTSQADGKSSTNALGNVHNEVRHDLLVSDAREIASTLTKQLIWPIVQLNSGGVPFKRSPWFRFDTNQPEDLAAFSESLTKLVPLGMGVPVSWARQKAGIPAPEDGEEILQAPGASGQQKPQATANTAVAELANKEPAQDDAIDIYTDRLEAETANDGETMLHRVRDLAASASSYEEFSAGLVHLVDGAGDLSKCLEQAFLAAELLGRFEVLEGD